MKAVWGQVYCRELLVRHSAARCVIILVKGATYSQAGSCAGGRNQFNDHLVGDEGLASPILGDERKQTMLDLVPLACPRRQVADPDIEA